jgi:hypothetical protein
MTRTRFCRVAYTIDDIDRDVESLRTLFDLESNFVGFVPPAIRVAFGVHGIEPIQVVDAFPAFDPLPLPFLEIALAVDDAEKRKGILEAAGYSVAIVSYLPLPDKNEYLFADIHGLPVMVCTDGDNELQSGYPSLEVTPPPRLAGVTVMASNFDAAVADFARFFDMKFTPCNPTGLGKRVVGGAHRLRFVDQPSQALAANAVNGFLSMDIIVQDTSRVHAALERAGISRVSKLPLRSGRTGGFYGHGLKSLPFTVYDARDEAELLGQ